MDESQIRFPGENRACLLRLLVVRLSGNRHMRYDQGYGCIWSLPVVAIVKQREGRTKFSAYSEILFLNFSVDIAWMLHVSVMTCKIRQKSGLSTPFHLSEEKQTKIIYANVYD